MTGLEPRVNHPSRREISVSAPADATASAHGSEIVSTPIQWRLGILPMVAVVCLSALVITDSFWGDEAVSAIVSSRSLDAIVHSMGRVDATFPAYYLLLHPLSVWAGASELVLRLPSLAATLVSIVGVATLGRALAGPLTGFFAAWLFALNPLTIYHANEARSYALVTMVTVLAALCARNVRRPSVGAIGWCALATVAALLHWFALLAVLPQWLWLVRRQPAMTSRGVARLTGYLVPPVAAGVIIGGISLRYRDTFNAWIPRPTMRHVLEAGYTLLSPAGLVIIALAVVALAAVGITVRRGPSMDRWRALASRIAGVDLVDLSTLALWALAPAAFMLAVSLVGPPIFQTRYAAVSMPAICILLGHVAAALWWTRQPLATSRTARRWIVDVPLAALLLLVVTVPILHMIAARKSFGARAAVDYLAVASRNGDALIFRTRNEAVAVEWYLRRRGRVEAVDVTVPPGADFINPREIGAAGTSPERVRAALRNAQRVWLVQLRGATPLPPDRDAGTDANDWLFGCLDLSDIRGFSEFRLFLFTPRRHAPGAACVN